MTQPGPEIGQTIRKFGSRRRASLALLLIALAALPLLAAEPAEIAALSWTPRQLRTGTPCLFRVEVKTPPSRLEAKWQERNLSFFPSGDRHVWYALAGVDVEANPRTYNLELAATLPDGRVVRAVREVHVLAAAYKTVRLTVPDRFVEPDPEALKQIESDKERKKVAFSHQTETAEWTGPFHPPVTTTVSEPFGTRRTLNGKLATIHRGLDYHAKEGTPVRVSNAGTVVLAAKLYYEGNCVIVDHGLQFMTLYMHLSQIEVTEGEKLKAGQEIGLSGATGRVTGPHLHVAVRWQGAYLDPAQLWQLALPSRP